MWIKNIEAQIEHGSFLGHDSLKKLFLLPGNMFLTFTIQRHYKHYMESKRLFIFIIELDKNLSFVMVKQIQNTAHL